MKRTLIKITKPWMHGLISIILGLMLLFIMMRSPMLHRVSVDTVSRILYFPEKPVFKLRSVIKFSSNWILERAGYQDRIESLEKENFSMSAALQKAGIATSLYKANYERALVTLRYPEEWWSEFRIDKGTKAGISKGAAVLSDGFFVGRVVDVGENYSWVELITSSSSLIAATIEETRELCILNGDNKGNLKLLYAQEDSSVKKGMNVSTSLMNEQIPPGVPIGSIIAEGTSKDNYKEIRIKAGAHLTQLYSVDVFVIAEEQLK